MPLIDEQTQGTDRRPPNRGAWFAVIGAAAVIWIVFALVVSFLPRGAPPPSGTAAVQQYSHQVLQQAQQNSRFGIWPDAVAALESLGANPTLTTEDKHT